MRHFVCFLLSVKRHSTFCVSALCMAVPVFSMPLATRAVQSSEEPASKATSESDKSRYEKSTTTAISSANAGV